MSVCSHHSKEQKEKKRKRRRRKKPIKMMMTKRVQRNVCFYYIMLTNYSYSMYILDDLDDFS